MICAAFSLAGARLAQAQSLPDNYRLKPGDAISMTIFQEPDMATASRVAAQGTVHFPFIGNVSVVGKTLPELQNALYERYNADYFVNPQISLQITDYTPNRVRVRGRVNSPGFVVIPPEERFTVADAIAAAGDVTSSGNERKVELHHTDPNGNPKVTIIDLAQGGSNGNAAGNIYVRDNDTIVVPEKLF